MTSKDFLYSYLNAYSPVGQEKEGQKIWLNYVKNYADTLNVDAYGTAWVVKKCETFEPAKKVVIESHADEIAWIITQIQSDGYIRVDKAGGSDNMIAASKTVVIHTSKGEKVRGVFGSPAIHVREKRTDMGPKIDELWIDCGVDSDKELAEMGIEVGNLVTFDDQFSEIGNYYVGKSLDNKIGGYIIAETLRRLHENEVKLPYDLYVVNAVQEEVGLFGSRLIAQTLQADIALVHDVCHNTSHPKMNKSKDCDTKGGAGPCVEFTSQNHKSIISKIRETASEKEIPLQLTVGSYGNDTVSFFLENTPTAIVATPLKYMHCTVEMAHKKDVESAIDIFYNTLINITPDWIDEVKNPLASYLS